MQTTRAPWMHNEGMPVKYILESCFFAETRAYGKYKRSAGSR